MIDQWAGMLWQRFKDIYGQKWLSLFQGDEAIESWRVTWASGLQVDADQIKHALSRLGTEFPEWPPTFGQFKALCESAPRAYVAIAAPKVIPSADRVGEIGDLLASMRQHSAKRTGQYWTPEVVKNWHQVNFIVMQARHFGRGSTADRFLDDCKQYGCITEDNQFRNVQRMREPGED